MRTPGLISSAVLPCPAGSATCPDRASTTEPGEVRVLWFPSVRLRFGYVAQAVAKSGAAPSEEISVGSSWIPSRGSRRAPVRPVKDPCPINPSVGGLAFTAPPSVGLKSGPRSSPAIGSPLSSVWIFPGRSRPRVRAMTPNCGSPHEVHRQSRRKRSAPAVLSEPNVSSSPSTRATPSAFGEGPPNVSAES